MNAVIQRMASRASLFSFSETISGTNSECNFHKHKTPVFDWPNTWSIIKESLCEPIINWYSIVSVLTLLPKAHISSVATIFWKGMGFYISFSVEFTEWTHCVVEFRSVWNLTLSVDCRHVGPVVPLHNVQYGPGLKSV